LKFYKLIFVLIFFSQRIFPQELLRISSNSFGYHVVFEAYPGDILTYKLKGENKFRQNKISALSDSVIIFDNDLYIKFSELKRIRYKKNKRLINTFSAFFIKAGFLFIIIDTTNNLLLGRPKVVNEAAALISAGLVTTGLIIKRLGIKKIRINKNKTLKIIDVNYQHLNK